MHVRVWVCPRSDCGHYYASSNAPDLRKVVTGGRGQNFERWPEREHPMSQCPACGTDKLPIDLDLKIPATA